MLNGFSYDDETKELSVTFKNGKEYTYVDVDKSIYDGMSSAASAGKFFNSVKSGLVQK
jgi:hypothetical protein